LQVTLSIPAGAPLLGTVTLAPASWPSAFQTFLQGYDQFRVDWVDVVFVPRWNVNTRGAGADEIPSIAAYTNVDDNTTPSSFDAVVGTASSTIQYQFVRPFHVRCKPTTLQYAATGLSSGSVALASPAQWYNTAVAGTAYLFPCCKYGVSAVTNTVGLGTIDLFLEIHFTVAVALGGGQ